MDWIRVVQKGIGKFLLTRPREVRLLLRKVGVGIPDTLDFAVVAVALRLHGKAYSVTKGEIRCNGKYSELLFLVDETGKIVAEQRIGGE